jgi:hypothetical protein
MESDLVIMTLSPVRENFVPKFNGCLGVRETCNEEVSLMPKVRGVSSFVFVQTGTPRCRDFRFAYDRERDSQGGFGLATEIASVAAITFASVWPAQSQHRVRMLDARVLPVLAKDSEGG